MPDNESVIQSVMNRNLELTPQKLFYNQHRQISECGYLHFSKVPCDEYAVYVWLVAEAKKLVIKILQMQAHYDQFKLKMSPNLQKAKKQNIILQFSWALEHDKKRQKQCEKNFRFWFDENAQIERYWFLRGEICLSLRFLITRIGAVGFSGTLEKMLQQSVLMSFVNNAVFRDLQTLDDEQIMAGFYQAINSVFQSHLHYPIDANNDQIGAYAKHMMENTPPIVLLLPISQFLFHVDVHYATSTLKKILLHSDDSRYDIFTRRALLDTYLSYVKISTEEASTLLAIPACHVRQALTLPLTLQSVAVNKHLIHYFTHLENNAVLRASMIFARITDFSDENYTEEISQMLLHTLQKDQSALPKKVALQGLIRCYAEQRIIYEKHTQFIHVLQSCLITLKSSALSPELKRSVAILLELICLLQSAADRDYFSRLTQFITQCDVGKKHLLPKDYILENAEKMFRAMSAICYNSWPLDIEIRSSHEIYIFRGIRFRRKLWRLLYEFRHPSSEKCRDISHTSARYFKGDVYITTSLLYDVTQTMVPGDPLLNEADAGYHPFLPLVDQCMPVLHKRRSVQLYSPDGITTINSPDGVLQRFYLWLRLTITFSTAATLRNVSYQEKTAGNYVVYMRKLGASIVFDPHYYVTGLSMQDESVMAFFQQGERMC